MKKILYTLIGLMVLSSCASIQKKVDQGDYDGAIILAARKLSGKKKKKTKHIVHLETAFEKVMDRDLNHIAFLQNSGDNSNWDRIYDIYRTIQHRQDRVMPFLPLVSKDGYAASFKFIRVEDKLIEAANNAAAYHYQIAGEYMDEARNGNKESAKRAFHKLQKVEDYVRDYKNTNSLVYEALELGQTRIGVRMRNSADVILPLDFEREIMALDIRDLDDLWTKYYFDEDLDHPTDYTAVLDISFMDVSPERERVEHHVETKEIEDGFEYVLDENGNVMKDTLGNDIKVPRMITIIASVTKLMRHKKALVEGRLILFDEKTGRTIEMIPISANAVFDSHKFTYEGDRRALCNQTRSNLKGRILPFPTDFEITMLAVENLKRIMKEELQDIAGI